jgi:murein L,D-transpeptidase YcbB/YkuD
MPSFRRRSIALLKIIFIFIVAVDGSSLGRQDATASGDPQAEKFLRNIVVTGSFPELRWPDFSDYRTHVANFYEPTGYTLAWVRGGQPTAQAQAVIELLRQADRKGLNPEDYDSSRWSERLTRMQHLPSPEDQARFDVALTVCTMRYISDLRIGRINPQHFKFGLSVEQKKYDLAQFLRERVLTAPDMSAALGGIEPPFRGYRRSEQALAQYMALARNDNGEQLPIPAKPVNPGQPYAGVLRLTRFLHLVGDLPPDSQPSESGTYDSNLSEAIKRFQRRHGLADDGRLGRATVKQLNVPLKDRVRQLQLTLERWRWLPTDFSAPPIVVNIPDFRLRALDENNNIAFEMRVVVGKDMRTQTPVFSRDMTFIVLRPYWNIPPGIFRRSVLPAIQRDRGEVARKNYEITTIDGKVVTAGEISDDVLAQLQAGKLAVRQKPGPNNAPGLIKLMFLNEYSGIYTARRNQSCFHAASVISALDVFASKGPLNLGRGCCVTIRGGLWNACGRKCKTARTTSP